MNNTIMINGADFSNAKIDSLNLQKLTVTKGGNGYVVASNGNKVINSSATWASGNFAYSDEITIPEGAKYLFGKLVWVKKTTDFNKMLNNLNTLTKMNANINWWANYHNGVWLQTNDIEYGNPKNRPQIVAYKNGVLNNGEFTAVLTDGALYGIKFPFTIEKIVVNWIRRDSNECKDIGLDLPEIYVGF